MFDLDGRWLTTAALPKDARVLAIKPPHVLALLRDDLGVERVALYTLTPAAPAAP